MSFSIDNAIKSKPKVTNADSTVHTDPDNPTQFGSQSPDGSIPETVASATARDAIIVNVSLMKEKKSKKKKAQKSKQEARTANKDEINDLTHHPLDDSSIISDLSNNQSYYETVDIVINATGRRPNIDELNLKDTDIKTGSGGDI